MAVRGAIDPIRNHRNVIYVFQEITTTFRIIKFANIIRDFPAFGHDKVIHTWDKTTTQQQCAIACFSGFQKTIFFEILSFESSEIDR